MRRAIREVGCLAVVCSVLAWGAPAALGATTGCIPNCSTYDPGTQPTCSKTTIKWSNGCGGTCSRTLSMRWGACSAPTPTCDNTPTTGVKVSAACPGVTQGCTKSTNCDPNAGSSYAPYGYAVPGDPVYGFPSVPAFTASFPTPSAADMLGLAAKGNIIIGDYTSSAFQNYVLPKLSPTTQGSVVQPYVVDPSDAALGYQSYLNTANAPVFNGDYTKSDGGHKGTNTTVLRKFYESSLTDAAFQSLINPNDPLYQYGKSAHIDAVLYTNHAIAGYVPPKDTHKMFWMNGSMIGRDDALVADAPLTINHDIRLNMDTSRVGLPASIARPILTHWQECTAASPCN